MAARVAAISSAPSGAPWAAPVLAFFGAPLAMVVLQQIRVGRAVSLPFAHLFAFLMALSTASTSWPSTFGMTCQP
jgi:hypothetical protein